MAIYDVLVAEDLLAEFNSANPRLPGGFRIVGPADGPAGYRSVRMRVEDDNAPEWTDGKLIDPTFTAEYDDDGAIVASRISSYREIGEDGVRISSAVQQAEDNPGRTVVVEGPQ